MYAPGTGRKWCLMNVLMYLWLSVLALCVLLASGRPGAGVAVAMHLQTLPPSFPVDRRWRRDGPPQQMGRSSSSSSGATATTESVVPHNNNLFSLSSSNLNASDLDKRPHSQLDNVWYRIWRRRRQIESLRRRRSRRLSLHAEPVEVHDTRPSAPRDQVESDDAVVPSGRTKRDSRFGRYPTRMFQPSQASSSSSQGSMHLHPKFYPPSPPMPSAVASPSLTSARQRLGFEQHSNRPVSSSGHDAPSSPSSHNTMLIKPKDQHGLPGSPSGVPIPHSSSPVLGSNAPHHHNANIQNHHQQHNASSHHHQGGGGHKGGGGLLQMRGRKYCSARDPANLAFEAGVVFEGRVRSMSTHNYSVTFQVLKVHKTQPGFPQLPTHIRVHFKQVKNLECDLHRENFRNPAHIRGKLDQGKVYFIFGKFVELNNFTLIGQPMRSSEKHQREVRNGLSETYGEYTSLLKRLTRCTGGKGGCALFLSIGSMGLVIGAQLIR